MKKVLAIDMGATSIRGILGYIENGFLQLDEVMRINHKIVEVDGRKYWEWDRLISEIEKTIINYHEEIVSIGVDTWGVDFGLLNENEELVQAPLSYRDEQSQKGFEYVEKQMPLYDLFRRTGNQILSINSLFQLIGIRELQPQIYHQAKSLLMMPDLVNYYLTGVKKGEKTICSTTQMFDLGLGDWNQEILERLELPMEILPEIIENRTVVGTTKNSLLPSLRGFDLEVISVASHDTASAVALTEAYWDPSALFLSSGTWSLLGCFTDAPVLTEEAFALSLTNETGYNGRNMCFQNITGLYLIEKLRHELEMDEGRAHTFDEITEFVSRTPAFVGYIDPMDGRFGMETGSMVRDIEDYFLETGQPLRECKTDYYRVIYESMVLGYCELVDQLHGILGRTFRRIHVIGGGSRSDLLMQMLADGLKLEVLAGPQEATAIGNIMAQMEANAGVEEEHLREAIHRAIEFQTYVPEKTTKWDLALENFRRRK